MESGDAPGSKKCRHQRCRRGREWAERARRIDPDRQEAWELEIRLEWQLERDEEAIALCDLAAQRFPALEYDAGAASPRTARLVRPSGSGRQTTSSKNRSSSGGSSLLAEHCKDGNEPEAISVCEEILSLRPDHIDALATAFSSQRAGDLERALGYYERLRRLQPSLAIWKDWQKNIEIRLRTRDRVEQDREQVLLADAAATAKGSLIEERGAPPRITWSGIAGEFLQEHWQKLILCLAVLLIVVSSTVGAQLAAGRPALVAGGQVLAGDGGAR